MKSRVALSFIILCIIFVNVKGYTTSCQIGSNRFILLHLIQRTISMKFNLKALTPHLLAIGIFLVVSVIYCKPALEGMVLQQHDWIQWTGMSKDAENYKEKFGEYPQWTQGIFSGMPSYQIAFNTNAHVGWFLPEALGLFLPNPIKYFFLAALCFYFLTVVLRVRTEFGILGGLAFAFATYNPVIISVGHHTKMLSIAMMPAVLAGWFIITQKKYWLGAGIMALFMASLTALNHMQITYYLMLVLGIMGISYAIIWIREKQYKHLVLSATFAIVGLTVGILSTAVQLFTTYEYAQRSIRGGSALNTDTAKGAQVNATGLDSAYAMSYSMGITEPLVLAVAHMFGGSNSDPLPEDGKLAEVFSQYQGLGQSFPASAYWGGIGGTSGPPYSGAIVCFLAILSLAIIDNKYRWWIAAAIALSIIMSWGGYFYSFNGLLLKFLPFYDKFRAPSMIMVIPQVLLPLAVVLGLQKISELNWAESVVKAHWKKGLIATGVLALVILGVYFGSDFTSSYEGEMMKQVNAIPDEQTKSVYKAAFSALSEDRQTMALNSIIRSFVLAAIGIGLAWLLLMKKIKPLVAGVALSVIVLGDLLSVDVKYLNSDSYAEPTEYNGVDLPDPELLPTQANLAIQQDTGIYRVYDARQNKNVAGRTMQANTFSDASQAYHHRMINGYHAAKLSLYQDLIERQLSKGTPGVFNMLNARYFIVNDARGGDSVMVNPGALGTAWLVQKIDYVKDANAEMNALDSLNVSSTAVVQESNKPLIAATPVFDSTAYITTVSYNNMEMIYRVNAPAPQFAVFSEIFYDAGWEAYADGKKVPIVKTNYALRGVAVPAGTKEIVMKFDPASYRLGYKISFVMQILIFVLLAMGIWIWWKNRKKA